MSKTVGILSMQRVINYGSFLQAYALRQMLLKHGAKSVDFIDIREGNHLKGLETDGFPYYIRRIKAFLKLILKGRVKDKKHTMTFMIKVKEKIMDAWPLLGLDSPKVKEDFDLAVIGSDEVFHFCHPTKWGFTTQLYGDIPEAKEVVSYAGSFGGTKIKDIEKYGIGTVIAENLIKLKYISVRDENSKNIVERLTGIKAEINIDPVLAYGFKEEIKDAPQVDMKDYILVYSYPDRINDPKEIKAIIDFAKKSEKKLVCVMSNYSWCDMAVDASPFELLSWFKNADMVITETFHGTIFSIITEKQFVTIGRESAMPKLTSMLEPYGLSNRLYSKENSIESIFSSKIDFSVVNKKLQKLRNDSNTYFQTILN